MHYFHQSSPEAKRLDKWDLAPEFYALEVATRSL